MRLGGSIRAVWIDAELLGGHVHVEVKTGKQFGQQEMPTFERSEGWRNDAGGAGKLILREEQWSSFIRALAIGGHMTGLRVLWRFTPSDGRLLWNGCPAAPCLLGDVKPVTWEPA